MATLLDALTTRTSLRKAPWWTIPVAIFLLTRIVDAVLLLAAGHDQPVSFNSVHGLVSAGHRTYGDLVQNWDGQWYRQIAEDGYPHHLPEVGGQVQQNPWAFFPLYPALVRVIMVLTRLPFGLAATVVSGMAGMVAMCVLYRMLHPRLGRYAAGLSVLALCSYPAAPTLQFAYTESLALALLVIGLASLEARRYTITATAGVLLALTRPIVLPLAAVVGVHWVLRWRRRGHDPFDRRAQIGVAALAIALALSFLIWPAVAAIVTGKPSAYLATQAAWSRDLGLTANRTWFIGALHANPLSLIFVLGVGAYLLLILCRTEAARWTVELRGWVAAYSVFVFASTPPVSSVLRYAMLAVLPWWPIPEIGRIRISPLGRTAIAIIVLVVGALCQYYWLRWYYVVGPDESGFP